MHDREFEKQVQQKMQELRFQPGADVWTRVQADIQRKRRRRPIIFFLLFAGLMTCSVGAYFMFKDAGGNDQSTASRQHTTGDKQSETSGKNNTVENQATDKSNVTDGNNVTDDDNVTDENNDVTDKSSKTIVDNNTINNKKDNQNITSKPQPAEIVAINKQSNSQQKPGGRKRKTITSPDRTTVQQQQKDKGDNDNTGTETVKNDKTDAVVTKANTADQKPTPAAIDSTNAKPVEKPSKTSSQPAAKAPDSIAMKPFGAKAKPKKRNWQWGVHAGVGLSDIGYLLPRRDSLRPNQSNKGNGLTARWGVQAGFYASKPLNSKLRLKVGVNYEYFSHSVKVGWYYNSPRLVNQSSGSVNVVDQYYTPGDQNIYTNGYSFVSLPLSLQWKFNQSKKHDLVWENGITPAWLIASNTLNYDYISSTYYEDKGGVKKTQLMIASSLLFSFTTKSNMQLYVGPHLQYGLTNLYLEETYNQKHLRYAGLKLLVGFNKK